jgi:hypothetical protein
MDDSQNYYITPPTIFLPEEGIRITIIGTDEIWAEQLSDDLEDTFPTVPITFYHLDENTADNWQWLYYMVDSSDLIMVNVGKCKPIEMNLALLSKTGNRVWFYVDKESVDKDTKILLNSINANVFNNSEELHAMLRNFVGE